MSAGLVDRFTPFDSGAIRDLFRPSGPGQATALGPIDVGVAWMADSEGTVARNLARLGAAAVVVAPSRPPASGIHIADHLVATLAPLGVVPSAVQLPLTFKLPAEAIEAARRILDRHELATGNFVIIQPGSGSPAKNWPIDRFLELARQIAAGPRHAVLLVGPAELESIDPACYLSPAVPVVREAPLATVAALIAEAGGYVGNDSGPTHLAAALGRPTVALFGPSDPAVWAPRGPRVRILRRQPLGDLSVDMVLMALR